MVSQHGPEGSTDDLLREALSLGYDDHRRWDIVVRLQDKGSREVLDAALRLCSSQIPEERILGVDILAQGQTAEKTFHEEIVVHLLSMIDHEDDARVLESICVALGHRHDPRAIEPLVSLKRHPSADVRHAAVFGLLGFESERALAALVDLSTDEDAEVRDWATFGLGSQVSTDTPELRDALAQRLADPDTDTRHEAIVGLASRADRRAVGPLLQEVSAGRYSTPLLEAAEHPQDDPRVRQAMIELRDRLNDEAPPQSG